MRPTLSRTFFVLACALGAAVATTISLRVVWPHVPVDDAFITFRYAENLANGSGLVFNAAERIEGYTSLTWLLALSLASRLGFSVVPVSKVLGLLLGLATLVVLARAPFDRAVRLWAIALLALFLPASYHFANGLETAAMTFLLTLLVVGTPARGASRVAAAMAAALLPLTRPEGLLAVPIFASLAWSFSPPEERRFPVDLVVAALVAAGAQLAFRWFYYGELVANSVRAKMLPLDFAAGPGLLDLGRFFAEAHGSPLVLVAAGAGVAAASRGGRTRIVAAFVALFGVVLALGGGDSFPLWRFFVPLAPALFVVAASGIVATARRAAQSHALAGPIAHALILAVVVTTSVRQSPELGRGIAREGEWKEHWIRVGRVLAETFPPETTIALCPVGALPWASGLTVVDMLGLTDPEIARAPVDRSYFYPGHQRHDADVVLSRRPQLILLANGPLAASRDDPFPWNSVRTYERDVIVDPRFRGDYAMIHLPLEEGGLVQMFARKDFLNSGRN